MDLTFLEAVVPMDESEIRFRRKGQANEELMRNCVNLAGGFAMGYPVTNLKSGQTYSLQNSVPYELRLTTAMLVMLGRDDSNKTDFVKSGKGHWEFCATETNVIGLNNVTLSKPLSTWNVDFKVSYSCALCSGLSTFTLYCGVFCCVVLCRVLYFAVPCRVLSFRVVSCCAVLCCAVLCCVVWCGVVWCGVVWCGAVRCGAVRCGAVRCGVVWCGAVRCGVVLCCVVLCCVVLCCVVLCCVVLCCVVLCCVVLCCVVLCCAEGAVTRRQWPGCLPTGTGKREGCVS